MVVGSCDKPQSHQEVICPCVTSSDHHHHPSSGRGANESTAYILVGAARGKRPRHADTRKHLFLNSHNGPPPPPFEAQTTSLAPLDHNRIAKVQPSWAKRNTKEGEAIRLWATRPLTASRVRSLPPWSAHHLESEQEPMAGHLSLGGVQGSGGPLSSLYLPRASPLGSEALPASAPWRHGNPTLPSPRQPPLASPPVSLSLPEDINCQHLAKPA